MNKLILGFVSGCAAGAAVALYWGYPLLLAAAADDWSLAAAPLEERAPEPLPEAALYNQRELLDAQFRQLRAGDPERIELYFLGVAGDGDQGVFRRELGFVKGLFDDRFDTAGRSLTLVNGAATAAVLPLATRTSIGAALQAAAQRMNPEQDILFVYLTSHGSENFELVLAQHGVDLQGLPATELAALLAALPLRHKVVVISACYSGGFIPALAGEDTLVITAAAADRASFGCSDLADFTYFGEAYFKQALAQGDDFIGAFERASVIVTERERREQMTPSLPQISRSDTVIKQLERWQAQRRRPAASGTGELQAAVRGVD